MTFSFSRTWNFEAARQMDTGDLSDPNNPETEFGAALAEFFDGLAIEGNLPAGGDTGDVLTKASATDGDAGWVTPDAVLEVPPGGATGEVLAKASATDGDTTWVEAPLPATSAAVVTYGGSANLVAADVEAALDELDAEKAAISHTHAIADTTGLQTELDNKVATITAGIQLDYGTSLPGAGQEGRLFVVVPA